MRSLQKIRMLIAASAIMLVGCTNEMIDPSNEEKAQPIETYRVSVDEAADQLKCFLNAIEQNEVKTYAKNTSKSEEPKKIKNVKVVKTNNKGVKDYAKSIGLDEMNLDTLLYVINFEDNAGFSLLGADKRSGGIYALVDSGYFDAENPEMSDNPGFIIFMENAFRKILLDMKKHQDNLSYASMAPDPPGSDGGGGGGGSGGTLIQTTTATVAPKLKVKWGQGLPYNHFCPDKGSGLCPTGCAVTAVAQILSYFPTIGSVSWSDNYGSSLGTKYLNWSRIISDSESNIPYGVLTLFNTASIDEVAHLMRYLGVAMGADYQTNSTSVDKGNEVNWMRNWGGLSATSFSSYNDNNIINGLNADKLICIGGFRGYDNWILWKDYWGGHLWVIDGYRKTTSVYTDQTIVSTYVHCNFGWNGSADGYYNSGVFDTSKGPQSKDAGKDQNQTLGTDYYRYNLEISVVGH